MPCSSRNVRTSAAASRTISNVVPGDGSRSMRSSSIVRRVGRPGTATGGTRGTPWLAAHSTWARSAITIARDSVPLTVATVVVCSQSGAESGIRFWKNDWPPTPFGNRCSSVGRSRTVRISASPTAT